MAQTDEEKAAADRKRRTPARRTDARRYRVLVSFDGLDKDAEFEVEPEGHSWAQTHTENGYLQDVTAPEGAEDERSDEGQR